MVLHCKNKLCKQSVWLLQLRDYPYYENFMNAALKKELIFEYYLLVSHKMFYMHHILLISIGKTITRIVVTNNYNFVSIVHARAYVC